MLRQTSYHALAALVGFALVAPFCAAEAPKTADEVIALNLAARGGADKIAAMKTMRATGKMTMGPGMEAPITLEWRRPNKVRMEFTMQGMTGITAYDGETAWMLMPFMGQTSPERMPEAQAKDTIEQADAEGALVNYKEKGHQVEYLGVGDVEGTPAYKLKVTTKNGDVDTYYIDVDSNLQIREDRKRTVNGQEVNAHITYGDYKEVSGLMMPHSMEAKSPEAPAGQVITIEKVEVNPDIPDARFSMPPAAPKPPGG